MARSLALSGGGGGRVRGRVKRACMGVWRRELPEGRQGALNKVYATSIRRPYHGFSPHLAEAEHRQTNNLNLAVKCDNNVQD